MAYEPELINLEAANPDSSLEAWHKVNDNLDTIADELALMGEWAESHTHTKAQIVDFAHTHVKADVTDFGHQHSKADVTDFSHGSGSHSGTIGAESQVTFDPTSGHNHDGSGSRPVDHGNLLNKGTSTHAQLDAHLSASAPHGGHATLAESGCVPNTQLGSGPANAALFLRGDHVWATADIDVVGGRLTRASPTSLVWRFTRSNQIMLFEGTDWTLVKAAAEPTIANTANDLGGDALTYDVVYDAFAEYSSPTAFTLVLSKWASYGAGTSARTAAWASSTAYKQGSKVSQGANYYACMLAHTSSASDQPGVGANWQTYWADNGTDPGPDFRGLYRLDGRWVSSNSVAGKKRRWLGVVMLINSSGAKFEDSSTYRYVANYYNAVPVVVALSSSGTTYTYAATTWRESNAGANITRGRFCSCVEQTLALVAFQVATNSATSVVAQMGPSIDSTTAAPTGYGSSTSTTRQTIYAQAPSVIAAGAHYLTTVEALAAAGTITYYLGPQHGCSGILLA